MTTIDGLRSAEHIARAKALRRASVAIATHAEPGPTRAHVLEKLALLIADLEGMPGTRVPIVRDPVRHRSRRVGVLSVARTLDPKPLPRLS